MAAQAGPTLATDLATERTSAAVAAAAPIADLPQPSSATVRAQATKQSSKARTSTGPEVGSRKFCRANGISDRASTIGSFESRDNSYGDVSSGRGPRGGYRSSSGDQSGYGFPSSNLSISDTVFVGGFSAGRGSFGGYGSLINYEECSGNDIAAKRPRSGARRSDRNSRSPYGQTTGY